MVKPPFIVLDGYHDRDREGRDYLKDGAAGFERTQPYQYIIPYWRFILADNRQMIGSDCAHFEMQYMKCMEAFGARLGRQYCDLEQRDLEECVSNEKKRKRFHAMRDIRFKQWLLRGDRKTMYEPIDPYLRDVKPDTAGMTNKPIGTTEDMNGFKQEGIGRMDMTIKDGRRWSTAQAYLNPILNRPNLYTTTGITVTSILFHRQRAIGIEFVRQVRFQVAEKVDAHTREKIYCEDAVILAAGAINSPQLLMNSGIGDGLHLYSLQIPIVQEMQGVGQNLQDHLEIYIQQKCTQPITLYDKSTWRHPHNMIRVGAEWFLTGKGLAASSHLESGGFARSSPEVEHPDLQFHFLPSTVHNDGRVSPTCHAYQVHVGPMRSKSRGEITLQNTDPRRDPLCNPRYMSEPEDWVEFRRAVRLSRELFAQKAFDEFRGEELAPGDACQTDEEIDEFIRQHAASAYHPSCTCKMGPSSDPMAVVDPETMNVHGFENLKIVDASVMPSIVSGNLNAPVIMIAEKAADIIAGKKPLAPENPPIWTPSRN